MLLYQEHIYKLMKSDSYSRFIRSSAYQELLQAKKKVKKSCLQNLTEKHLTFSSVKIDEMQRSISRWHYTTPYLDVNWLYSPADAEMSPPSNQSHTFSKSVKLDFKLIPSNPFT